MGKPLMYDPQAYVGKTINFLTIVEEGSKNPGNGSRRVVCRCRCGSLGLFVLRAVVLGRQKSCGRCWRWGARDEWACRKCGNLLPFTNEFFNKSSAASRGLKYQCKKCENAYQREYGQRLRTEALMHYGNGHPQCVCCGLAEREFLCLDHINDDGKKDRELWGLGTRFYMHLKRSGWPPHLQILCFNCNFAKSVYGICPHKR